MTVNFAHCFFEQSGTFKKEFARLGIPAHDYDLLNQFGETDMVVDLFSQIEKAFAGKISIFDTILPEDLVIAFFPCTYFCSNNELYFCGTNFAWRNMPRLDVLDKIIERAQLRQHYYDILLKFIWVLEKKQLRCIIENPYNAHHYWRFNLPVKPAVIDMNRRLRGDYYRKPTQYLFINCTPSGKKSILLDKKEKFNRDQSTVERSMISTDYAHNFICDNILGIDSGHTQPTLFN